MYVGRDWSPAAPGEAEAYTLDFVNDIDAQDSLVSATWTCAVASWSAATDASAASRVTSPGAVGASNGRTKTSTMVSGLLPNVTYVLEATAVTTFGNTVKLHSHVVCQPSQ